MSALPDSDQKAIVGFHPVHRVAQSYLGSLWIALDKRQGDPGTTVLLRRVQLPSGTPLEARQCVARAGHDALALRHPNLLTVIEVLQEDQELALVYEHVEGEPLRSLQSWANLRGLTFPVGVSLKIIGDLLHGLSALHAVAGSASVSPFGGLSPDSLLVSRAGDARLCDPLVASCATLLDGVGSNTAKLGYAAPEQVHAVAPLTATSDVFTCGAMLWELLAARRLLSGSRAAIERKLLEHSLPNLATCLRSDQRVSRELIDLVGRTLSADPAKRPQSPAALWAELQECGHEVAPLQQVAQFVGKLSGQRFDRRTAAVRSKSLPELEAPLEWPVEVGSGSNDRNAARPPASAASAASAPVSDVQTERNSEPPPASSALASPAPARAPAAPAAPLAAAPRPRSALAPSAPVAVQAPRREPKPVAERQKPPAAPASSRQPSPSYIEPPPIPESVPAEDEEDENDATIREQPPGDWLGTPPGTAAAAPARAAEVAPVAAPAVPIAVAAVGRRTVAGVGTPAHPGHPALAASRPFANLTPGPFAARSPAAQPPVPP
ncbi:MAG: protein kinase, partial [Deltaproteobacteria bacterium]